ncbi:Molybdenum cofactor synthesis domain protein [Pseudorhizobium banfieldiae]|uniref:Molybdopterin molybdenumtransferase n=1 Tax=Pseudorhizobium banfieldiae TaxID=1125847 RepID=L0NGR3_9HYPH|nr:gephyrin-like molybdotransferase Glp [Pseudorhizobium banfieldiae]CAD6608684.1 molybdopterin molybdenumtransferase MoeA [arsenite-oxidising bacterium NT-25]CCF19492.1 Molybdenum cofactor synthesis domain protein [Pseudorhizobium banfieldiae]
MGLLPVPEAKTRLLSRARPIERTETVPLAEANGRVLAKPLAARLTQPPFDASAMDGYALRAEDAQAVGATLLVTGMAAAGHPFEGVVAKGEAVRIFTGAPLPTGADTVLLQEDAELLEGDQVRTKFEVITGRHIRPRGQDFVEGEAVLPKDTLLDYSRLTVAAAMNHPIVEVYRRPRVAILATGDELLPPGHTPQAGQIIASNMFGISALIEDNGGEVVDLGIAADNRDAIRSAVDAAKDTDVDVLVTSGGASVGDHDLVQSTLKEVGMELDFWRIAMRPGKPLMVGSLGNMHVLGLPGNPVASLVCGLLFLEPLLRKLGRLPERNREGHAVAARDLAANDRRQDYLRSRLSRDREGNLVADAFEKQDSSMMKILAHSDALIVRPPNAPALTAGTSCPILLLRP